MGFLANLVKVFPSLAKRPLHLIGESYAGVYIVRHVLSSLHIRLTSVFAVAVYNKGLFRAPESARQFTQNKHRRWFDEHRTRI
jgi:hypothetical protein